MTKVKATSKAKAKPVARLKPVKAWMLVDTWGQTPADWSVGKVIYDTRACAEGDVLPDERIARVEIREIK